MFPISPGITVKTMVMQNFLEGRNKVHYGLCENGELKSKPLKVVSLKAIFSVVTQHVLLVLRLQREFKECCLNMLAICRETRGGEKHWVMTLKTAGSKGFLHEINCNHDNIKSTLPRKLSVLEAGQGSVKEAFIIRIPESTLALRTARYNKHPNKMDSS